MSEVYGRYDVAFAELEESIRLCEAKIARLQQHQHHLSTEQLTAVVANGSLWRYMQRGQQRNVEAEHIRYARASVLQRLEQKNGNMGG